MTPGGSFSPRKEGPQEGPLVLEWNDPMQEGPSLDPRMERLQEGPSILGWNEPRGVIEP